MDRREEMNMRLLAFLKFMLPVVAFAAFAQEKEPALLDVDFSKPEQELHVQSVGTFDGFIPNG